MSVVVVVVVFSESCGFVGFCVGVDVLVVVGGVFE